MFHLYIFLKALVDPLAIVLLLMGFGIWILKDLRKERSRKWGWWIVLASFFVAYFLSASPVVSSLAYLVEKDYLTDTSNEIPHIDVIVVLGGGSMRRGLQSQIDPSNETSSRLLFGLQALKRSSAEIIILSGGGIRIVSEAEVMARTSEELGIDKSRIMIETDSQNTWEQAIEINRLLKNRELTLGIVTSALHMKRSLMVFSKYFDNIVPLPSKYLYSQNELSVESFLPNSQRLYISSTILREIVGMLWYRIRT